MLFRSFHRVVRDRPQIILKLAVSADWKIASKSGGPTPVTGDRARDSVHLLRAQCDAIVVGMGTAIADNPRLDCRLSGLERRSPIPFVLSRSGRRLPPGSHLETRGAEVLGGQLPVILSELAGRGINRLLVEGGAKLAASFLRDRKSTRLNSSH